MTPEEFQKRISDIAYKIPAIIQASMEQGINTLYAEMDNRIFNANQTITGASFGGYESEAYAALRASIGRQSTSKDLQVFGNLAKSMGVNYDKRAVIVNTGIKVKSIPTKSGKTRYADPSLVMKGQEGQIAGTPGRGIFEASDAEAKASVKEISYWWSKLIREAIEEGSITPPPTPTQS